MTGTLKNIVFTLVGKSGTGTFTLTFWIWRLSTHGPSGKLSNRQVTGCHSFSIAAISRVAFFRSLGNAPINLVILFMLHAPASCQKSDYKAYILSPPLKILDRGDAQCARNKFAGSALVVTLACTLNALKCFILLMSTFVDPAMLLATVDVCRPVQILL